MTLDFKLLKELTEISSAPGFESKLRNYITNILQPYVDDIQTDNFGNLYVLKKGTRSAPKKVVIAAHMDEIGFIVSYIDKKGFIRFHPLGGFDPKTLTSMRVAIQAKKVLTGVMGCKPVHIMNEEDRRKAPKISNYFIDIGLSKEEAEKYISPGNSITRYQELIQIGELINGKSLDNRVSCYILIETLKRLENVSEDIYGVFTVQEEVGIRGAAIAGHQLNPDWGIALDVTVANDIPDSSEHEEITKLGCGVGIKIMDGRSICDYRMVNFLKQTAERNHIKWQTEILHHGGTDTEGIQRSGKQSAIAGALSIPLRYMHQTVETAHPEDIVAEIQLLCASLKTIHTFDWKHV